MPQMKQVKSLRKACVDNVAENMDSYWCKYFDGVYDYGEGRAADDDGPPFECLTGSLVTEIIETLKNRNLVKEKQWFLLITSTLEALRLSQKNFDECPVLYQLISQRCKDSLKELRISDYCHTSQEQFLLMLETLRKLEILDLHGFGVKNEVLAVLGSSCPELREINVSGSERVTNQGIKYLCVEKSSLDEDRRNSKWKLLFRSYKNHTKLFGLCGGAESIGGHRLLERNLPSHNVKRKFGRCKLLSRLHLRETQVDETGIDIAIRHLPNLKYLDHHLVVSVLGDMNRNNHKAHCVPTPQYSLQALFAGYGYYNGFISDVLDTFSLSRAVEDCPNITEVHFDISNLSMYPDALKPLCEVNHLKKLDLSVLLDAKRPSFYVSVVPILKACGHSIETLHLAGFMDLDAGVIGKCCPSLEVLLLFMNRSNCDGQSTKEFINFSSDGNLYSYLKIFRLNTVSKVPIEAIVRPDQEVHIYDIPKSHLKDILSAPLLESIKIFGSSSLTDSLLKEVMNRHSFDYLRELEFGQCHSVSAESILMFLQLTGPLNLIALRVCQKIGLLDFERFISMIKKNNWELSIVWETS